MALFSTWYSGGGPVPREGQGPSQLRRSGVSLPFHFAFPVLPSLSPLPAATLPCEGHEGTSAGLFPHSSTMQPAPPWHRAPTARGKLGARRIPYPCVAHWCRVFAVNQGSRVVLGSGEGKGCVSTMPCSLLGMTFLFFTITRTLYYIHI